MLSLRPMTSADLDLVAAWLAEPHVARWWLADTTAEAELAQYRDCIDGREPTNALIVLEDGRPVGWCQWYRWDDYPRPAAGVGASDGDAGIDYALGALDAIGRGLGTELIELLVATIRAELPAAGIVVDPAAANVASRRVLEKNGFRLQSERVVDTEPSDEPVAIYRRSDLIG